MKIKELARGKYVIAKSNKYGDDYYKEDCNGYTKEIMEAGIYNLDEIPENVYVVDLEQYHLGKHKKIERYAVELTILLMLM